MNTVAVIVRTRHWNGTLLTWPGLYVIMHNLFIENKILIHFLHAGNRFLGAWLKIRIPHRGTSQFPLNKRLHKENETMKKLGLELNMHMGY